LILDGFAVMEQRGLSLVKSISTSKLTGFEHGRVNFLTATSKFAKLSLPNRKYTMTCISVTRHFEKNLSYHLRRGLAK
jgi:hypothetical protein